MIVKRWVVKNEANCYCILDESSGEAALVDAGEFPLELPEFLSSHKATLSCILVTHEHYDHTDGLKAIKLSLGGEIVGAAAGKHGQGDVVLVGNLAVMVLGTPGHTPDSLSFQVGHAVFTGDALFAGSVGGTENRAKHEQELDSIRERIFGLPADTVVYPGHGAPSTVGIERCFNPFFV